MARNKKPTTDYFVNLNNQWVSRRRLMWRIFRRLNDADFKAMIPADKTREILDRYYLSERNFEGTIRKMIDRVAKKNREDFRMSGYETDDTIFNRIIDDQRKKHHRMATHEEEGDESVWEKDDDDMDVDDDGNDDDDPDVGGNNQPQSSGKTDFKKL